MILDKRTARMMKTLLQICADGSYKIIEIKELQKGLLPRFKADEEAVGQIIRFLSNNELIDVKYNDENVYCISVLPKGRVFEESKQRKRERRGLGVLLTVLLIGGCFLAAFLGAFVASFIN